VKKLLGYLQALAERHNLTIVAIGHANKGKHDHFADTVMGASAWTNSPRLSFFHAADVRENFAYVMRVAKTNFDPFGLPYGTKPVHTLYERAIGPDTVLVPRGARRHRLGRSCLNGNVHGGHQEAARRR
jgi:hypothetical protein